MKLDIRGIDKNELLAGLFNASTPRGLGFIDPDNNKPMTAKDADAHLRENTTTYFDYLNGRLIKIDIGGDYIETSRYDQCNGEGAAERVVNALKARQNVAFAASAPSDPQELFAAIVSTHFVLNNADATTSSPSEMKAT